ncbi:hypothetical protein V2K77_20760 [Pseudomonas alliivorans]|nr:hypothetical protein [Pseudomonas alliivorans]MEE4713793.1 hypothetical protein [Pseudomonas alliivorans]MEE4728182.1 hypothetical protein [Pseudomonas alliivorans]MEE4769555.1 hypothetical protein [Pseudomonas alliivorans]
MQSRYMAASSKREEVAKTQRPDDHSTINHKLHEDVSPASRLLIRTIMPVQLHQSALWAAYIREHLDGLPSLFNTSLRRSRSGRQLHNAKGNGGRQQICSDYFQALHNCPTRQKKTAQ